MSDSSSTSRSSRLGDALTGLYAAARFLLPPGYRDEPSTHVHAARSVAWMVPLGLLTGLAWVLVFRAARRVFGESVNLRMESALCVVLVECLITGPFLAMGLARTVHLLAGERSLRAEQNRRAPLSPVGSLVLILVILSEWVLIATIPMRAPWWPSQDDWRHYFNFMYPEPLYRPLILAPIWGRWGILLGATVGKTAEGADAATASISAAMRPARLLRHAALPLVLTAIYFSRGQNFLIGVILGLLVFAASYFVSFLIAWRGGGQTRQSLFASGQIAQLAFLAAYRCFWPIIHG